MSDEEERARLWESFCRVGREMVEAADRLPDWKKPEKVHSFWESLQRTRGPEQGSTKPELIESTSELTPESLNTR